MEFQFHQIDTLPRLAWCAVIERGSEKVEVFHGPWVETCDFFFVEGAWDGPFKEGGFDMADAFMGSGGKLIRDKVVFCTPSHIHERLHLLEMESQLYISPSLTFLLKKLAVDWT